jgi:hypothetical protein
VSDHFICMVESSGCIPPEVIVGEVRVRVSYRSQIEFKGLGLGLGLGFGMYTT